MTNLKLNVIDKNVVRVAWLKKDRIVVLYKSKKHKPVQVLKDVKVACMSFIQHGFRVISKENVNGSCNIYISKGNKKAITKKDFIIKS